jgi:hypothetical protein
MGAKRAREEGIMGSAREAYPVKLIASLFSGHLELLHQTQAMLSERYGPVDWESDLLSFDHTDYYAREFGPGLRRRIVAFERLVEPADLPSIKLATNELEVSLSQGGRRRVNIDPGYVSLGKLVLATTKDHAHRLYLGQGIYGEVTLRFQQGSFGPWPWTYPDYASDLYCQLFSEIREKYRLQLRREI